MFYKILSSIMLISIVFSGNIHVSASDSSYEYARDNVLSLDKWSQYIETLETAIAQLSDSKLKEIENRIETFQSNNIWDIPSDTSILIHFVDILIKGEQEKRNSRTPITTVQKTTAEQILMELQWLIGSELREILEIASNELLSWSEYKETGTINLAVDADIPGDIQFSGELDIEDYSYSQNWADARFQWSVKGLIESIEFWEKMTYEGKSLLDIISKDGRLYWLMKDFNFSWEDFDEYMIALIKKIQELSETNTYISFDDATASEITNLLANIWYSDLETYILQIEGTQIFEAYMMQNDAYLLRPTKEFCDEIKALTAVFDPFGGDDCSENQYEDLLEEFYESGLTISLIPGVENRINMSFSDAYTYMDMNLLWNSTELLSANFDIYTPEKAEDEYMNLSWIFWESLSMDMNVDDLIANMITTFNKNGGIGTFEMSMNAEDIFTMNAIYRSNYFDMKMNYDDIWTNYECNVGWPLKSNKINLEGWCSIQWGIVPYIGSDSDTLTLDGNLEYEKEWTLETTDINLKIESGETLLIDINLDSQNNRFYTKTSEIIIPENVIDFSEVEDELIGDVYENYDFTWDSDFVYQEDDYSYELVETEFDDYSQECYNYSDGEAFCTNTYTDWKVESCNKYAPNEDFEWILRVYKYL